MLIQNLDSTSTNGVIADIFPLFLDQFWPLFTKAKAET